MPKLKQSKNRGSQLRHSTESLQVKSSGRTKPIVAPEYIVGLTDGEGCFYVHIRKSNAYKAGCGVQLHFHIKVNEKDKEILEKVKNTLNCGGVYFQKEKRLNHAQCYRYTVASNQSIIKVIIPFFKKHQLQTFTKKKSFENYCNIAELIKKGKHLTFSGVKKIQVLKTKMNQKTIGFA